MPVAQEFLPFLQSMSASSGSGGGPPSIDQVRAGFVDMCRQWTVPSPPLASITDRTAGEIPIRVYRPDGDGALPTLVFFHGGGFFVGSIDTHDDVCRAVAARSGWVVVSVDYRLAPEHPFPAASDDAFAALQWVAAHAGELGADPARLAVGGDSAGGNLAAVTALRARDEGGPQLSLQVLIYPVTDWAQDTSSMAANGSGYFLTADAMRMTRQLYLPDPSRWADPYAAPLRAPDVSGVAPAIVVTAEFDPLRDEGEAYADRLAAAGVPVDRTRCAGMIHGFVQMLPVTPRAGEVLDLVSDRLRKAALEG
jgi:acetyl esterase